MLTLVVLATLGIVANALTPYDGPRPNLTHIPFGYGGLANGGSLNASAVYVATNASELREALALPYAKTVYVQGVINGNEQHDGTLADCQYYIDHTGSDGAAIRSYNFTLYLWSLNSTYLAEVEAAAAANETFDGLNATEYRTLLGHMNGWRPVVSQTQKASVAFNVLSNTSLIGLSDDAALNGINLKLSSVDNVWVRNLKVVSPADCFPAPETYPSTWNADYDAFSLVTSTNIWVDQCELQDQINGSYVIPDTVDPGWQVDRFDGLFDCEDGTDNVTFSHNIVRNHHKSMLLGGGTKEADRDLGLMHFTMFGNHFVNSASRSPLLRFGTADIFANVFEQIMSASPVFSSSEVGGTNTSTEDGNLPADAVFEYNIGVYNQSSVQVADNVWIQSGSFASDTSRIFTLSEDTSPNLPAHLCVRLPGDAFSDPIIDSTVNGAVVNISAVAEETIDYFVTNATSKAVAGGVLLTCADFSYEYTWPTEFNSAEEVEEYVLREAGQVGAP
ncbi:polysaccharide lyase family 1 protein [Punctularia strigosozonata HHB-11173 SS5]|uniref:polysaccharide lyase family 1 protein n=1 Tax=Punctularia strigosozonata (strain HHB-11173) TaxID=741275 RepID=UPI0004418413|nr:polysaccharide lyase family 1 protein [Punctularia strigosozonata HHB-11173 SS5]EIN09878.1 polysaccharide lyase family 1 protein [Punctularia strigosozonata HHB-11173 SS5]